MGPRNRALVRLALVPWPLGVLLVLPASLPVPHWLSLLYVLIAGIGAVWFTDFSKAGIGASGGPSLPDRLAAWPWALYISLLLISTWLRAGVSL